MILHVSDDPDTFDELAASESPETVEQPFAPQANAPKSDADLVDALSTIGRLTEEASGTTGAPLTMGELMMTARAIAHTEPVLYLVDPGISVVGAWNMMSRYTYQVVGVITEGEVHAIDRDDVQKAAERAEPLMRLLDKLEKQLKLPGGDQIMGYFRPSLAGIRSSMKTWTYQCTVNSTHRRTSLRPLTDPECTVEVTASHNRPPLVLVSSG